MGRDPAAAKESEKILVLGAHTIGCSSAGARREASYSGCILHSRGGFCVWEAVVARGVAGKVHGCWLDGIGSCLGHTFPCPMQRNALPSV